MSAETRQGNVHDMNLQMLAETDSETVPFWMPVLLDLEFMSRVQLINKKSWKTWILAAKYQYSLNAICQ